MKNLFLLSLSMFILLSSFSPKQKGYKYESSEAYYSIVLPASFTVEDSDNENFKSIKVSASLDNINIMSTAYIHKVDLGETDELEEVSLASFTETLEGKIISKKAWSTKGASGTKAILSMQESQIKLEYLVVFKHNIQYQMVVFANSTEWNQTVADNFFSSIKFK